MATGTRVRDWATVDFYATLGLSADATDDEIARAFRALAKHLHPDARQHDPGTDEQFHEIAAAYEVLGDPRNRLKYDRVRAMAAPLAAPRPIPVQRAPSAPSPSVRRPWTRRRSWTVIVTGIVLTVLGILAAFVTWDLHTRDAHERARFVPVHATRVAVDGKSFVAFTADGRRVLAPEPRHHGDPVQPGESVAIRYDPADPQH